MKEHKKIFISIIAIVILIIIIIAILLINLNKKKELSNEEKTEIQKEQEEYINTLENPASLVNGKKPELVKLENIYFNAKNSIDKYFSYVQEKNAEAIINVLDQEYKDKNGLNNNNILSSKILTNTKQNYIIEDMYSLEGEKYTIFYVKLKINNELIYLIINIDFSNRTFSIIPSEQKEYEDKINTVVEGQTGKEKSIEPNNYNALEVSKLKDEDISNKYLMDFKEKMISYSDIAYSMIDEEYKQKKFPTLADFKKYIQDNMQNIQSTILAEYGIESKEDYKQYTCVDNHGNKYIFKATSAMKYTVLLDDYTVETDEYKEKYSKLNESNKISTNIEKFIKCINNKDYNQAYSFLDEGFKNNYFNNLNDFIKYIENNFYENNVLGKIDIQNEGNTFICKIPIKSGSGAGAKTMTKTIFMELREGTNFVMSFNMQ